MTLSNIILDRSCTHFCTVLYVSMDNVNMLHLWYHVKNIHVTEYVYKIKDIGGLLMLLKNLCLYFAALLLDQSFVSFLLYK